MTPSPHQQAILDAVTQTWDNLLIQACAGAGKTTTLRLICERIRQAWPQATVLCVAFNKPIADEMARRLPPGVAVSTLHSHGFAAVRRAVPSVQKDDGKLRRMAEGIAGRDNPRLLFDLVKLAPLVMATMVDSQDPAAVRLVAQRVGLDCDNLEAAIAKLPTLLMAMLQHPGVVTFDEMIYHPLMNDYPVSKFDFVLVDETQDLNESQQDLVAASMKANGRIIGVGDRWQCQPFGTMVTTPGGAVMPIETLKKGDAVIGYDRHGANFIGRMVPTVYVNDIKCRLYTGLLFTVKAEGKSTRCTNNHKWLVRFTDRCVDKWAVYLMKKGNAFRVGWTQFFMKSGSNHLALRSRLEKADCSWVLGVFDNKREASLYESHVAAVYGIPLLTFRELNGSTLYTEEALSFFWNRIEAAVNLRERAVACLVAHGKDIDYPFYKGEYERRGRTTLSVVETCNLMPGYMKIPVYNEGAKEALWASVDVSSLPVENMPVISLDVDKEYYIADGLCTHNSIYGFRGADPEAMERMRERFHMRELRLPVTWRCPTSVVSMAQTVAGSDIIEARPGSPPGLVITRKHCDRQATLASLRPGDMVVARTNAPLIRFALALIAMGVKVVVRGRDFGADLVRLVDRFKCEAVTDLLVRLGRWRSQEQMKAQAEENMARFVQVQDKYDCITTLAEGLDTDTVAELRHRIESIFDDEAPGVVLSTVHKAKGLEARHVVLLGPEMIPHPMARRSPNPVQAIRQEMNIKYVALTRAMEMLTLQELPPRRG